MTPATANRNAWVSTVVLALGIALTVVWLALDPREVASGDPVALKPLKFLLSFAIHVATLAWIGGSCGAQPPTNLQAELDGCDKLFLLGPNTVDQADLEQNALDAAKSAGVKHIVKQSVMHAQDDAYNMARMHRGVEKSIEASGTAWTFLRPNSFMQNTVTFMGDTIRGENSFYTASGDAGVSIVDVKDIAAVALEALTAPGHEGHAYTLTGPEALTHDQLAGILTATLGRTITHIDLSADAYLQGMLASGMPAELAERMLDLERYIREGRPGEVTGDIAAVTGRAPRSFGEFVQETAATGVWAAATS